MPDMLVNLMKVRPAAHTVKALEREHGVRVFRAIAPDKFRVVEWVKEHSGISAAGECDVCFAHTPVSCFIAVKQGQIVGYACYDATAPDFFGPTRVSEECRGLGVGKALLLCCLNAMKEEGYVYAIIGGVGPVRFYETCVDAFVIPDSDPGIYGSFLPSIQKGLRGEGKPESPRPTLRSITAKDKRLAIGLMSGTCTDGIDAALVEIRGHGRGTSVKLVEFLTQPYDGELREKLLTLAGGTAGGSRDLSMMNFLLGKLSAEACLAVCEKAGIAPSQVDFVGSHGHTIYHQPSPEPLLGHTIRSTLQIGEAAVIAEAMGCPVAGDFRVRDVAAGGQGAPLVPYAEYLLYSGLGENVALQNVGGIGNVTFLPAGGGVDSMIAFDTGPGNMVIDQLCGIYTQGRQNYDDQGRIASAASVSQPLLDWLMEDPYLPQRPPKTTGREYYGKDYTARLLAKAEEMGVSMPDVIATATMFTSRCIEYSVRHFLPKLPARLIVGGGGSRNLALLQDLKACLPECLVQTNEDLGLSSDAKEAIAFAVLGNETLFEASNNVPGATGASHPTVMGKISF